MVIMGCIMLAKPDDILMPGWLVYWLFTFGFFQLILGGLAARGAVVSKRRIESGRRNMYLDVFLILLTILMMFEMACVIIAAIEASGTEQEELTSGSSAATTYLEDAWVDEMEKRESFWWDLQKNWECCGWRNNTIPHPLATGKFCTTNVVTSAVPCLDDLQ
eukprot:UN28584